MITIGLIWIGICTLFFSVMAISAANSNMLPFLLPFIIVFEGIGIVLLIKGLKVYLKNKKIEKNGKICYGVIKDIEATGGSTLGHLDYNVSITIYLESENKTTVCSGILREEEKNFPIGKYAKVKYYNGDVNFIAGNLTENDIPDNIQPYLKKYVQEEKECVTEINSTVSYLNDDFIEINGVKYKKEDE